MQQNRLSHPRKRNQRLRPKSPSEEELLQRELGWDDRAIYNRILPYVKPDKTETESKTQASKRHSPAKDMSNIKSTIASTVKVSNIRNELSYSRVRNFKQLSNPTKRLKPLSPTHKANLSPQKSNHLLRAKVLKAIDIREGLIYQLHGLILCTPLHDPALVPSRPNAAATIMPSQGAPNARLMRIKADCTDGINVPKASSITTAREATKIAQKLAIDLQLSGIQCIEAIVEWMLVEGANSPKPPIFLWRDMSYMMKMTTDLNFAEEELNARGINIPCYGTGNPLLIKPNQRLGRLLAAQQILNDMVAANKAEAKDNKTQDSDMECTAVPIAEKSPQHNSVVAFGTCVPPVAKEISSQSINGITGTRKSKIVLTKNNSNSQIKAISPIVSSSKATYSKEQTETFNGEYDAIYGAPKQHNIESGQTALLHSARHQILTSATQTGSISNNQYAHEEIQYNKKYISECVEAAIQADENMYDCEGFEDAYGADIMEQLSGCRLEDNNCVTSRDVRGNIEGADIIYPEMKKNLNSNPDGAKDMEDKVIVSIQSDVSLGNQNPCMKYYERQEKREKLPLNLLNSLAVCESDSDTCTTHSFINMPHKKSPQNQKPSLHHNGTTRLVHLHSTTASRDLCNQLQRSSTYSEFSLSLDIDALACIKWIEKEAAVIDRRRSISAALENRLSIFTEALNGSFFSALESYNIISNAMNSHLPLVELLTSDVSKSLCLTYYIRLECMFIIDCVFDNFSEELRKQSSTLFGSDLSIGDLLIMTNDLFQEYHKGTWNCIYYALRILSLMEQRILKDIWEVELKNIMSSNNEDDKESITDLLELQYQNENLDNNTSTSRVCNRPIIHLPSTCDVWEEDYGKSKLTGLSNLLLVYYPHLIALSRDNFRKEWVIVKDFFEKHLLNEKIHKISFLLEAPCKILAFLGGLVNIEDDDASKDFEEHSEINTNLSIKVVIICDRDNILATSCAYMWERWGNVTRQQNDFAINYCHAVVYPFFRSQFGEKCVDGIQVEAGEGKGPLKEWFELLNTDLVSPWRRKSYSDWESSMNMQVNFDKNQLKLNIPMSDELQDCLLTLFAVGNQIKFKHNEVICTFIIVEHLDECSARLDKVAPSLSISFVNLQIFQPYKPIFHYTKTSESCWFQDIHGERTRELELELFFVGWWLAMAILQCVTLQTRLSPVFFRSLLHSYNDKLSYPFTLDEAMQLKPDVFESIRKMSDSEFAAFLLMEDQMQHQNMTKDIYIQKIFDEFFGPNSDVQWQIKMLVKGFNSVLSPEQLCQAAIYPKDLAILLGGSNDIHLDNASAIDFSIQDTFEIVTDNDFAVIPEFMETFWMTVNGFTPQLKREFLKFVTGVTALPLPRTEILRIEIPYIPQTPEELENVLYQLPQSHTCENILELPHYWKGLCWKENLDMNKLDPAALAVMKVKLAKILQAKFEIALNYTCGYGLDATVNSSFHTTNDLLEASDNHIENLGKQREEPIQDSYESLELPMLGDSETNANENALQLPLLENYEPVYARIGNSASATKIVNNNREHNSSDDGHVSEAYEDSDWEDEIQKG